MCVVRRMVVVLALALVLVLVWRLCELEMRMWRIGTRLEVVQEDMRAILEAMTRLSQRGRSGRRASSEKGSEGSSVKQHVMQWRRDADVNMKSCSSL